MSVSYTHLDVYKRQGNSMNEEQITWSDGKIHTIVTNKQLYIEKSTGKKFIIGTIHDVSVYKKIEDELRTSCLLYTSRCV